MTDPRRQLAEPRALMRKSHARFLEAHAAGMKAITAGDYPAFSAAVEAEREAIHELSKRTTCFVAPLKPNNKNVP
jgi:hypothetical protein